MVFAVKKQQSSIVFSRLCTAMYDVFLVSLAPVLSQAPHTDPDSPQQTIRTLCIKTRLWNEDSEFRERQTERTRDRQRKFHRHLYCASRGKNKFEMPSKEISNDSLRNGIT